MKDRLEEQIPTRETQLEHLGSSQELAGPFCVCFLFSCSGFNERNAFLFFMCFWSVLALKTYTFIVRKINYEYFNSSSKIEFDILLRRIASLVAQL